MKTPCLRPLLDASCYGGLAGTFYSCILLAVRSSGGGLIFLPVLAVLACFISIPLLMVASLLAQFIFAPLAKYHRHQTIVFAMTGGLLGAVPFILLRTAFFAWHSSLPVTFSLVGGMNIFIEATMPFAYGAATGAFAARNMRNCP